MIADPTIKRLKRLWRKVQFAGLDDCWEWVGSRTTEGYGRVVWNHRQLRVPRIVWEWSNEGELTDTQVVRHTCDNPGCVNPKHLLVGTTQDNTRDRGDRNRHWVPQGCDNPNSKLTPDDVRAIRAATGTNVAIGKRFSVYTETVRRIRKRIRYKNI